MRKRRLNFEKVQSSEWLIDTKNVKKVHVHYNFYASELNAGSTFLSNEQLYVNPVNCFVFTDKAFNEPVELNLNIPDSWDIACSMKQNSKQLIAANFDELFDSQFIVSNSLQHKSYEAGGVLFHIWFNGEVKPDWDLLLKDFIAFSEKQITKFTEFPVDEYHFLFQILPFKAYHGVEHTKSTVISLGPSYEVFGKLYKELLGVSSHELYHTWNIKTIRQLRCIPIILREKLL